MTRLGIIIIFCISALALFAFDGPSAGPPSDDGGPRDTRGLPMQLNHQGVVMVAGERFNGNGFFRFALVDSSTGINAWTNDGTHVGTTGMPAAAVGLVVINGIYNVGLGDTSQAVMVPLTSSAFNLDNLVLRIWFDDGVNGVQLLSPDQKLTTVPYAFRAQSAVVADNALAADTAFGVVPVGAIVAWTNHLNGTPDLPDTFVECNGQVLTDPDSPLNGQTIPNLNSATGYNGGRFLRGTTGTTGGMQDATEINPEWDWRPSTGINLRESDGSGGPVTYANRLFPPTASHSSVFDRVRPVNMTVVWIMRVK